MEEINNNKGALTIPMLLFTSIFVFTSLSVLKLRKDWRQTAEKQIQMDQCLGKVSLNLKDTMNAIESSNKRLRALRILIIGGLLNPTAFNTIKYAIRLEGFARKMVLFRYKVKQAQWLINWGCRIKGVFPQPLPSSPWIRLPPDLIGEKPLLWPKGKEKSFNLRLLSKNRRTKTQVHFLEHENHWKANYAF